MSGLKDIIRKNQKKTHTYKQEFAKWFDKNLSMYMDSFTGFDIVKFDEDIGTPNGVSLKDHIQQIYGKEAGILIRNLLK